jgi:DNA-binding response OmpR family regulator
MAKILVVDDDKVLLKLVSAVLSRAGFAVTTVEDGHGAVEKLKAEPFDLVISDANMPGGVSGFDLAATIRKQDDLRDTAVMLLTGRSDKRDVSRALKLGVDDYVLKPVNPEVLLAKVRSLLQKKPVHVMPSETPIVFAASMILAVKVTSVSEQGLSFLSNLSLPLNTQIRLDSETFSKIRINPPVIKVSACSAINGAPETFRITAKFESLTSGEFQLLRAWLDSHAHLRDKKVS